MDLKTFLDLFCVVRILLRVCLFGLILSTNPFRVEFGLIFSQIKVQLQEMHDFAQQDNEAARSILRRKIHIQVLLDPFYDILLVKVSYKLVLLVYIVSYDTY